MRFSRRRQPRRFQTLAVAYDLVVVGAVAFRLARRPAGTARGPRPVDRASTGELALAAAAAFRLARRVQRRRRRSRLVTPGGTA